jgi:hypothetical protein
MSRDVIVLRYVSAVVPRRRRMRFMDVISWEESREIIWNPGVSVTASVFAGSSFHARSDE